MPTLPAADPLANVYPILGVCLRDGYPLRSGTDIAHMDNHYWVVECQVCGRAIAIGGQVPATSAMGPHAMLGPHGEPVLEESRCVGSGRPGSGRSGNRPTRCAEGSGR